MWRCSQRQNDRVSEFWCNSKGRYACMYVTLLCYASVDAPWRPHLSVTEAKQQGHAKTLARGHHCWRDLVHGFPRRAGFRPERGHDILKTEQRDQYESGSDCLACAAGRRGHLVVAVHTAIVFLETVQHKSTLILQQTLYYDLAKYGDIIQWNTTNNHIQIYSHI